jgi:predicted nucleic acid-binding protein
MKVVSNATPIITLSSIDRIDILQGMFGHIIVSRAVYNEIKAKRRYGYDEIDSSFIEVKSIQGEKYRDLLLNQLDIGEAETIILAKEIDADFVIIDENLGYKIAKNSDLQVIRTLSILLGAKEKGLVPAIKPLLDEMIAKGRWYSKSVYETCLRRCNEI